MQTGVVNQFRILFAAGLVLPAVAVSARAAADDSAHYRQQAVVDQLQALAEASGTTMPVYFDTLEEGVLTGGTARLETPSASALLFTTAPSYASYTLFANGPVDNRIDVVCVGDGYTAGQMSLYWTHVENIINTFFLEPPLNRYASYFNVHVVEVISNESGVDEPDLEIYRDTALDMQFNCSSIDRLLCVDYTKAWQAASNAPAVDLVLVLANSSRYGGAGYSDLCTVSGANASAVDLALHEFGHAFADLADEYYYSDGATYSGEERPEANVSIYTAAQQTAGQIKWYRWLSRSDVDDPEGGFYKQYGIYRPTAASKMKTLTAGFGPVNSEQFVFHIYDRVSLIDGTSPVTGTPVSAEAAFDVICQTPEPDTLQASWSIEGVTVPGASGRSFCPADFADYIVPNTVQMLTVSVSDQTALVRDEDQRLASMTEQYTWQVWMPSADLAGIPATGLDDLTGMALNWLTDEPTYDTIPAGGDGVVNMLDFSDLAAAWNTASSSVSDGAVDVSDLMAMAASWMTSDTACDIAPPGGDGRIDMQDFAVLAAQWGRP